MFKAFCVCFTLNSKSYSWGNDALTNKLYVFSHLSWHYCVNSPSVKDISVWEANACFTIVSKQGLGRTFSVWTSGLCAASTGETDSTVGTAVTMTLHRHMASIYTPLPPQKHSKHHVQSITLQPASYNDNCLSVKEALLFQSVHLWTPTVLSPEQY